MGVAQMFMHFEMGEKQLTHAQPIQYLQTIDMPGAQVIVKKLKSLLAPSNSLCATAQLVSCPSEVSPAAGSRVFAVLE